MIRKCSLDGWRRVKRFLTTVLRLGGGTPPLQRGSSHAKVHYLEYSRDNLSTQRLDQTFRTKRLIGNLSAYALAVRGTDAYVCLDAGTVYDGIQRAIAAQLLSGTV